MSFCLLFLCLLAKQSSARHYVSGQNKMAVLGWHFWLWKLFEERQIQAMNKPYCLGTSAWTIALGFSVITLPPKSSTVVSRSVCRGEWVCVGGWGLVTDQSDPGPLRPSKRTGVVSVKVCSSSSGPAPSSRATPARICCGESERFVFCSRLALHGGRQAAIIQIKTAIQTTRVFLLLVSDRVWN